jgi:two-component system phosphate regulon sensor histidine kinase PhoR
VLVLDKEGIIRLYNAAALALFNTNNSLSDKPLDGFIKLEDEKGSIITTVDLLPQDSKPIVRSDIVLRYSQDDTASISIVSTPIRSTFGQERDEEGYVITMRDITREKSLEEERDEFISVISHELRTPVTVAEAGVSNALLMAKKLPNSEKLTRSLQTAHDQSIFLANMLNDLATFARAEKGTLELNLEEFDPRIIIETLLEDYHDAVKAKGMAIICESDPSTPLRIASNRLYIREILQNFVTNAIKYSDKGTITLSVRAKDKGLLYSVSDQGIGISTSDQKKIFQKFFRTEDYRTRSTNGTGLGLYIVKKLAKILNASFEVHSEVGKGSTFSLYVPDMSDLLSAKIAAGAVPVPATHQTTEPQTPTPIPATGMAQ